jgi:16S rRNA G966 N2-methylase RsmD
LALIGRPVEPGLVPRGFAEEVLARALEIDEAESLWEGATTLAGLAQKWNGHGQEKAEIKAAQMFCEIQLGEILGPSPGDEGKGSWASGESAHAQTGIPYERIKDLRRFNGWRDALLEEVRNGKRSRRSLLLLVDRWEAKAPDEIGPLDMRYGDFREVLGDVEPGSVTLVLTDPPYPTQYLPLWDALGDWSCTALISGGSLIAYCGQSILPQALRRLEPHLRYWWTIALIHGQSQMLPGKWVSVGWKPLVWFVREGRGTETMLADTVSGGSPRKTVPTGDDGSWAQSVDALEPIISALSAPGDLIVDPFGGSGTVGLAALRFNRRFIGAELNER